VTPQTAPALNVTYDPATNRQTGECADANGNLNAVNPITCPGGYFYDVENRMVAKGSAWSSTPDAAYSYSPGNKRVWRGVWSSGTQVVDELTFWSVNGQKLATYQVSQYSLYPNDNHWLPQLVATQTGTNYYFGGKLVKNTGGYVTPDRLGSIGKYFPYGQERPSATQDGKEKFATYFRDSETGLDYADQRYHQPGMGRFMTADRSPSSNASVLPGNWNRYAYVGGDPINKTDPRGLCSPDDDPPCYSTTGTDFQDTPDVFPGGFQRSGGTGLGLPDLAEPPTKWQGLSDDCQNGLRTALPARSDSQGIPRWLGALDRAKDKQATLEAAADKYGIDWHLLAAIGIRETGFVGDNIFQLSGNLASADQAKDLAQAADIAAKLLSDNASLISKTISGLSPDRLNWMVAASFNTGAQGQINRYRNGFSPDYLTAPIDPSGTPNRRYRNNYGENVLGLEDCFN
jgi:RHS repeat-associated protein